MRAIVNLAVGVDLTRNFARECGTHKQRPSFTFANTLDGFEPPDDERWLGKEMSAWESIGKSDEWYTPKYIFDALDCEFDVDVAAAAADPAHVPCDYYISRNSLKAEWRGFIWMNPPFGGRNGIVPWLNKFFDHGDGIALTPDRTSAPWFQDAAHKANALLFISPKIQFEKPDGTVGKSPGCGTALMSAGDRGRDALIRARHLGFVALPYKMLGK